MRGITEAWRKIRVITIATYFRFIDVPQQEIVNI
jgi:hypothetical protein